MKKLLAAITLAALIPSGISAAPYRTSEEWVVGISVDHSGRPESSIGFYMVDDISLPFRTTAVLRGIIGAEVCHSGCACP